MFTFNGTGTKFFGIKQASEPGYYYATVWATLFFLPIIPLKRQKIMPLRRIRQRFLARLEYKVITNEKLSLKEILITYLYAWLLMPVLLPIIMLGPFIFSIKEIRHSLGIPDLLGLPLIVLAFIWMILVVWKLKDWDDHRFFKKHH